MGDAMSERPIESDVAGELPASPFSALSRRSFVGALGAVAAGGILAACAGDDDPDDVSAVTNPEAPESTGDADLDEALQASDLPEIEWDMATSWPLVLETIYGGAPFFAEQVSKLSGGKFTINPAPGGELVPALEILQNVQTGAVASGHTASYYYVGVDPICQLRTCVPFGLNARGHYSWLTEGGGQDLTEEIFRERFGVVPLAAGNTGCQMGGWFNKEITSTADLGGLRFRIPGMGGQAMERLGVSVQVIPGGEIYQSLETGAIDGAEWVGPYDDLQQEFNKVADFYYYPGWWEPGPALDVMFPADAFDDLPEEYQAMLRSAAAQSHAWMLSKYDALNPPALAEIEESGTTLLPFPDDVMDAAAGAVNEILDENAATDDGYNEVLSSYRNFEEGLSRFFGLAEKAMLDFNAG